MATESNITEFYKGEVIEITMLLKNRDGTALTSPASQFVAFTLAEQAHGAPDFEWTTDSGEVALTDAGTSEFTLTLSPTDAANIVENKTYYYNVWSRLTTATPLLQIKGSFTLATSIEPAT